MEKKNTRFKDIFSKKNIGRFLDKQGFYIVLFLCLCIIGATAFFTSTGGFLSRQPTQEGDALPEVPPEILPTESLPGSDTIDIEITDVLGEDKEPGQDRTTTEEKKPLNPTPQPQKKNTDKAIETAIDKEPLQTVSVVQAVKTMMMPVEGNIIKGFAMEELVYSRTLKEWTTHSGIDIEGPLGTEVRAALGGIVKAVEEDALMGIVITLDHGEGLETVYAGLSTKDMVRVGQKVDKGQVLSGIGRTAAIEIADAPHLHFEVLLHGEYQDPAGYLNR